MEIMGLRKTEKLPYYLLDKEFNNKTQVLRWFKDLAHKNIIINNNDVCFKYLIALYNYCDNNNFLQNLNKIIRFEIKIGFRGKNRKQFNYFVGIIPSKSKIKEERIYYSYTECIKLFCGDDNMRLAKWRDKQIESIIN